MSTTVQAITHLCKHDIEAQKVYQFSCSINLCLYYVLSLWEKTKRSQNTLGSHGVKTLQAHTVKTQQAHTVKTQQAHQAHME